MIILGRELREGSPFTVLVGCSFSLRVHAFTRVGHATPKLGRFQALKDFSASVAVNTLIHNFHS